VPDLGSGTPVTSPVVTCSDPAAGPFRPTPP